MSVCAFQLIGLLPLFSFHPLGAAGLPSVSLAAGPGGRWCVVYRGLPPPAALLDARVVREIHLHSYHSPWCRSSIDALHGRLQGELQQFIDLLRYIYIKKKTIWLWQWYSCHLTHIHSVCALVETLQGFFIYRRSAASPNAVRHSSAYWYVKKI